MRMRERTRNGLNHMGRHLDRPEISPAVETAWQPPDWMIDGECGRPEYDSEMWFQPSNTADTRTAATICVLKCPVRELCLAYALDNRISDGTWGGRSERALRSVYRERDILAKAEGIRAARTAQRGYDVGKVVPRKQATT